MFKSKQAKFIALTTFIISVLIIAVLYPKFEREMGAENARLITIPLDNQNLVLSFDGKCLANLVAKVNSDKLIALDLQLLDLETNQDFLSSKSYYNPIGQLISSSTLVDKTEIITNGIAQLNVSIAGHKYQLNGPISVSLDKQQISFIYPYGLRTWSNIFSIFKRIEFVDSSQCANRGDLQLLVKELKNAKFN